MKRLISIAAMAAFLTGCHTAAPKQTEPDLYVWYGADTGMFCWSQTADARTGMACAPGSVLVGRGVQP